MGAPPEAFADPAYVFGKTFAREDKLPDGSKKKIYYHTDIQGNIMQTTDEQGQSIWKRDFLLMSRMDKR